MWRRPPIPISIPNKLRNQLSSQRRLVFAVLTMTLLSCAILAVASFLGDKRELRVILASPGSGDEVAVTLRTITISFNRPVETAAIQDHLVLDPPADAELRWRGRTLVITLRRRLTVGEQQISIQAGPWGGAGERLTGPFRLTLHVRPSSVVAITRTAAGAALIEHSVDGQRLLLQAAAISEFAVSPDGTALAAVTPEGLMMVDAATATYRIAVPASQFMIEAVSWSPDSQQLLARRRPPGANSFGLRSPYSLWRLEPSGDFLTEVSTGTALGASVWSPDGQSVAWARGPGGDLIVTTLATKTDRLVARGVDGAISWSADSRALAFEQGNEVHVVALDSSFERSLGSGDDVRSQPRFVDSDLVATLRQRPGAAPSVAFDSIRSGQLIRNLPLGADQNSATWWDFDVSRTRIVAALASPLEVVTTGLDDREPTAVAFAGERPSWLP